MSLRKDTSELPREMLEACETPFERYVLQELIVARQKRNEIINVLEAVSEQVKKTNGRVNEHDRKLGDIDKAKAVQDGKLGVIFIAGGAIWSIVTMFVSQLISNWSKS